jgi:SIR2-like domain
MIQRSFAELVTDLKTRRTVGDKPPVLLLGAGASIDTGIGAMSELFKFFGCADFNTFCKYIDTTTASERYRYLADFLQTRRPSEITPGYQALAALCAQNYFDLVLTTNMDPLLDDALSAARLWRRDYLLIVNGVIRPDRLALLLGGQSPRVKIVKLHGDLFQRFMAWTVPEMDAYLDEIAPYLKPAVADRDFLVVGYSLRDRRVRQLVQSSSGSIWFTHPKAVPAHLKNIKSMRAVVAPECAFEPFFPSLAEDLGVAPPTKPLDAAKLELQLAAPIDAVAQTMDDLMSATLAVAGPDGPSSTAFLIEEPRVILCDRHASDPQISNGVVQLIDSRGHSFSTRVIDMNLNHPFGPAILEAPTQIQTRGLHLGASPLGVDEAVQILVAEGTKTGISSGKVTALNMVTRINPIAAEVRDLVELECFVAPGAAGAPVVDTTLSVRGFVVAGSTNPQYPRSYAYPAEHWAQFVRRYRAK